MRPRVAFYQIDHFAKSGAWTRAHSKVPRTKAWNAPSRPCWFSGWNMLSSTRWSRDCGTAPDYLRLRRFTCHRLQEKPSTLRMIRIGSCSRGGTVAGVADPGPFWLQATSALGGPLQKFHYHNFAAVSDARLHQMPLGLRPTNDQTALATT